MSNSLGERFSELEKKDIFDLISEQVVLQDTEGQILYANSSVAEFAGLDEREINGAYCYQIWNNREDRCPRCPAHEVLETGVESESVIETDDDRFFQVNIYPVKDERSGKIEKLIQINEEVTCREKEKIKREKAMQELENALEKKKTLLNNIQTQVWFLVDPETQGEVNKARADFLGGNKEELKYKTYFEIYKDRETARKCIEDNRRVFQEKKEMESKEFAENSQGETRILSVTKTPKLNADDEIEYVICSAYDITDSIRKEEKIQYISTHDDLTGVYNRSFLNNILSIVDKKESLPLSIIMGDINSLKMVNDAFGRKQGNQYIKKTAGVIKNSCRSDDIIIRWGGDEFIILLPETKKEEAENIASRIKKSCQKEEVNDIPLSIALGCAVKKSMRQQTDQVIKEAEDLMYRNKLTHSASSRGDIVSTLINTLGEKSNETEQHSMRMGKIALLMGEKLDLPSSDLDKLSLLSILHDIGKIAISEKTLTKKEKLDEQEWDKIKKHPQIGFRIVNTSEDFSHIAQELLSHHERWDGDGYPRGLKGEEIPLLARILSIVDAYDVMTNGRPYKEAMTVEQAIAELERCAGAQFDPHLTQIFINLIRENNGML